MRKCMKSCMSARFHEVMSVSNEVKNVVMKLALG